MSCAHAHINCLVLEMAEGSSWKQPLKQDNLLTPKEKSSIVWNYFRFHTDKDGIKDDEKGIVCRLCECSIAFFW